MKRSTLLMIIALAAIGVAIAMAASVLHNGLSAKAQPSGLETLLARNARHLAIPASARKEENPILDSPQVQQEARRHFADHCAVCHGNEGSGHTLYGDGLYPKPPDLRLPQTQDMTDGELFWIIENGVRFTGMPAFSSPGAQNDSWKLVLFIRHLPRLTAGERIEMESNNPKGPEDREEEKEEDDFLGGGAPAPKAHAHHQH